MEYNQLLEIVGDEPVFESTLLLAGDVNPSYIHTQLARWTKSKRISQLRRGLYAIAPPYQKKQPHPFLVANSLQRASYISLQSALAFYGLIPENVNMTTSVSTGRPERLETVLGVFDFRHIKTELLFGYQMIDLVGQQARVATAEKALLDLIYLQTGSQTRQYLQELRLQNLEQLNLDLLKKQAEVFHSAKLRKAAELIDQLTHGETGEYEEL
jgi:predicted transcriptional regulator of viral defense system